MAGKGLVALGVLILIAALGMPYILKYIPSSRVITFSTQPVGLGFKQTLTSSARASLSKPLSASAPGIATFRGVDIIVEVDTILMDDLACGYCYVTGWSKVRITIVRAKELLLSIRCVDMDRREADAFAQLYLELLTPNGTRYMLNLLQLVNRSSNFLLRLHEGTTEFFIRLFAEISYGELPFYGGNATFGIGYFFTSPDLKQREAPPTSVIVRGVNDQVTKGESLDELGWSPVLVSASATVGSLTATTASPLLSTQAAISVASLSKVE